MNTQVEYFHDGTPLTWHLVSDTPKVISEGDDIFRHVEIFEGEDLFHRLNGFNEKPQPKFIEI